MTAARIQPIPGRVARQREVDYIANFQQQFCPGLAVAHPVTGEMIRLADWSAVAQMADDAFRVAHYLQVADLAPGQQWHYPTNRRLCYWIEPKRWGRLFRRYPQQGLVIECAAYARLDRYVTAGQDDTSLDAAAVEGLLQERQAIVERWSARYGVPVAYVLGLAAPTGWDTESIVALQALANQVDLLPFLVDLAALKVYSATTHEQSGRYIDLFEVPLGEQKVNQVVEQVKAVLLATGASRLAELQSELICSQGLLRAACTHLTQTNPDYRLLYEGSTLIIRAD